MCITLVSLRAVKHVLDALRPYLVENGGVLKAERVTFVEGRGNLMLEYCPEGASGGCGLHGTTTSSLSETSICMFKRQSSPYSHNDHYVYIRYSDVHWQPSGCGPS